ncbi:MAG TPA: SDR family oxidoreductase [Actinomycetota bacterium]|nr:SDR family oxidoreductase [Actinomycetota bacterium]
MVREFRSPLVPDANAGRVAVVTGGGTGIGRATAIELGRTGARVAICGRRTAPLEEARAAIEAAGTECLAMPTDVREPEQVDALLEAVGERFGFADVLVNGAGGQFMARPEDTSLKGFRAVHRLNVDAAWDLTTKVATRWMIPRRSGLVVFMGFSPRRGIPGVVHSSAARAALENLAGGLSNEWSRFGVRAVAVSCGLIDTEGVRGYGGEALLREWETQVPMKRAGLPEEVGATIAFLASPGGAYITGTTVVVDGGADAWGLATEPPAINPPAGD